MFGFNLDTYEVTFEIYIDGKLTSRQSMQAPRMMIEAQFVNMLQQIKRDRRQIKLKMSRDEIIWDNFENKERVIQHYIEVENR